MLLIGAAGSILIPKKITFVIAVEELGLTIPKFEESAQNYSWCGAILSFPAEEILFFPQNIVGQFKPASAHNSTWLRMREKEKERAKVEQEKKNAGNGLLLLSPLPLSCIITFLLLLLLFFPPLHLRLSFSHDPMHT